MTQQNGTLSINLSEESTRPSPFWPKRPGFPPPPTISSSGSTPTWRHGATTSTTATDSRPAKNGRDASHPRTSSTPSRLKRPAPPAGPPETVMLYVDHARLPSRRMLMSHLVADTPEELLEAETALGIPQGSIQYPACTGRRPNPSG